MSQKVCICVNIDDFRAYLRNGIAVPCHDRPVSNLTNVRYKEIVSGDLYVCFFIEP